MSSQRSEIPPGAKMGVRARVAEWPRAPRNIPEPAAIPNLAKRLSNPSTGAWSLTGKIWNSRRGFPGVPLRQRSSSEVTLSECDPEEIPELRGSSANGAGLFREYGSTSSIDVQGIPEQSFYEILNEFRTKKPPNPPNSHQNFEQNSDQNSDQNPDQNQAPREKPRRRLKPDDSIFKKLLNPKEPEEPKTAEAPKSWIWRKSFAHFDVQSIFFEAVSAGASAGTRRRNTTTGASAASAGSDPKLFSSLENLNSKENLEQDLGDDTSNDLLLSCPHFRNEIGGGRGERDVSFSKSGFSSSSSSSSSAGVLGDSGSCWKVSNAGVSVLEFAKGAENPERLRSFGVEHADLGATYYRDYFHGKEHSNYFGLDEKLGPVAVSVRRERLEEPSEHGPQFQQRLICRTSQLVTLRGSILEDATPSTAKAGSGRGIPVRELLEFVLPELNVHCLRLALPSPKVPEQLLKLDEQGLCRRHKVGILYCKAGQSSEEEMYNNEAAGPALDEFLTLLGEKVTLRAFSKYAAQLDTKTDSTGTHSLYTTYQDYEIMFHVSTMLPYTPNNRQQLLRKRHIGNDIVTIIFQEPGALPFTPQNVRSHFQHVFIIVRAHQPCSDNVCYSVAVTRSKDVPPFGPPVPPSGVTFRRSELFRAFLLAKAINGENAAHKSRKFRAMATRTRQEYLRDLAENYVTNTPLDAAGKFNLISLASKKKEKSRARPWAELESAGAVSWRVAALDFGRGGAEVPCVLGVSKELLVLVDLAAKEVVFNCFTGDVIGWSAEGAALRIYHGRGDLVSLRVGAGTSGTSGMSGTSGSTTSGTSGSEEGAEGAAEEVKEIVQRLKMTTPGCATVDMTLRRNGLGQLGFHVHPDGSVAEVEEYGFAWQAGLRRGSRLLEVCKVAAVALSHEQMIDLLRTSVTVTVVIVPPHEDGTPRRSVAAVALSHEQMIDLLRTSVTVTVVIVPPHEDGTPRRGWSESLALEPRADPVPPWCHPGASCAICAICARRGWSESLALEPRADPQNSPNSQNSQNSQIPARNSQRSPKEPSGAAPPAGRDRSGPAAPIPKIPGRGRDGAEHRMQVNVFGQPRLRASLRDLRSPRRVPKSSIEDDLKRLILMDNSCPEPEPGPPLQRTLSDESLCGGRSENFGNLENSRNSGNSRNSENSRNSGNLGILGNFPEPLPGGSRNTLPNRKGGKILNLGTKIGENLGFYWEFWAFFLYFLGKFLENFGISFGFWRNFGDVVDGKLEFWSGILRRKTAFLGWILMKKWDFWGDFLRIFTQIFWGKFRNFWDLWNFVNFWEFSPPGAVARLEPGLMPLPDTAGLEWATLVSAAKAYEVQRAVSLFSLADPALSPEPPPAPPPPPRAPPLPPLSPSPAPLDLPGKVSQLEAMLKQLHSDLEKEKQDKVFLQAEVANLRQNNRRLQQESNSAARQLRRMARIFSGAAEHQGP
ncbi:LOW QUALITY PROTEIN: signal-induced proliferation-associated 1-like protein 3 [Passerculus sandwichensis]